MSGILGYWNLDDRPIDPAIVSRMSNTLRHRGPDGEGRRTAGAVAFVQQHLWITPEDVDESLPAVSPQGVWLVLDGRIDSRDEIIAALGLSPSLSDAGCVLAAYAKWGDAFAEHLNGDFALALYDPAARRIVLARDALGIRPLYYFRNDRLFAFATEIKALIAHPDIPTAPSIEGVADFMLLIARPIDKQDVTCFENIRSLVPAHQLIATRDRLVTRRYWDFDGGQRIRLGSQQEYAAAFQQVFATAVHRRTRSRWPIAVSISGGFDSSSILCQALTLNRDRQLFPSVHGISYLGAAETEADERRYLTLIERDHRISIERFDLEPRLGIVGDAVEQVAAVEAPFIDYIWGITRYQHERSAAVGARTFLTGHWGDQILSSSSYLADLALSLKFVEIRRHLKTYCDYYTPAGARALGKLAAVDTARALMPGALLPLARRLYRAFTPGPAQAPWFSPALLELQHKFTPCEVRPTLDFHSQQARAIYLEARSKYHVQSMEWHNKAAALRGLTCAFPFLDRDLVQFMMAVPGDVQNPGGVPRGLARDALAGVMPDEIRKRKWKADLSAHLNVGVRRELADLKQMLSAEALVSKMGYVNGRDLSSQVEAMLAASDLDDCVNSWRVADLYGLEIWLQVFCNRSTNGRTRGVFATPKTHSQDAHRHRGRTESNETSV